jgi:hypothetical protein
MFDNILTCPKEATKDIEVLITIVGGNIGYEGK